MFIFWRNGGKHQGSCLIFSSGWFFMAMAHQMVLLGYIKEFPIPCLLVPCLDLNICAAVTRCSVALLKLGLTPSTISELVLSRRNST